MKSILSVFAAALILLISSQAAAQICGDANNDESYNIGDAVYIFNYLYSGVSAPPIYSSGDVDGYEVITFNDAVVLAYDRPRVCPPTHKKFSGPINSGYALSLSPDKWPAGASELDVDLRINTISSFIYLAMPLHFHVGAEPAHPVSVVYDPEFDSWSDTHGWSRIYGDALNMILFDTAYAPIGPFTATAYPDGKTVGTVHFTLSSPPAQDEKISMNWDTEIPPFHPTLGSSHYPVIVVDWNRGLPLAWTPALPGQRVPSLTVWGGAILAGLLTAVGIWLFFRKKAVKTEAV